MAIRTAATTTTPEPAGPTSRAPRFWRGVDRQPGGAFSEYGGPDFTEADTDRVEACHRRLRELAGEHRREADALLDELDRLTYARLIEVEEVAWQELGRGLVRLGYGGLWPALFALTGYGRDGGYTPGDEQRFLERDGLPVREPPAGWPWLWLAPRGPEGDTTGRNGTASDAPPDTALRTGVDLGVRAALAVRILAEDYCPDHVLGDELGDPEGPDAAVRGAGLAAWRAALDRAAALPPRLLVDALGSFRYLQQATADGRVGAGPARDETAA